MGIAASGEHLDCHCPDCKFRFACDPVQASQRKYLVCPNCGFREIDRTDCRPQDAQSVEILLGNHDIARWDIVAFKMPDSDDAGIKRAIGLPGESVATVDGNLLVNDVLIRKPIDIQKRMRIPVDDSRYFTARQPHWIPQNGSSSWRVDSGVFRFEPEMNHRPIDEGVDWLTFHPGRHYSHPPERRNQAPIEDSYGFNQSISRDLHAMDELFLFVEAILTPGSMLWVRFDHRSIFYEFRFDSTKHEVTITCPGKSPSVVPLDRQLFASPELEIEFSSFDLQLNFLINGQSVYQSNLEASTNGVSSRPLAIAAAGGNVELKRLRIWRDIYYFGDDGEWDSQGDSSNRTTGYILLGDNVPLSIDSRHWQPSSIVAGDIIGKVKIPINQ